MIPRSGNFLVDAQDDFESQEQRFDCGCVGKCVCDKGSED